jgi:hypothetical protein
VGNNLEEEKTKFINTIQVLLNLQSSQSITLPVILQNPFSPFCVFLFPLAEISIHLLGITCFLSPLSEYANTTNGLYYPNHKIGNYNVLCLRIPGCKY